jgi:crossover junction endodeoxyribonuclease RusA
MERAVMSIDFYWPTAARRDILNACQGLKPAIDGIVDAGVLPDDNWKVLTIGHIRPHVDRANPRVVLTLETGEDV